MIVSIIIPSSNGRRFLEPCLLALRSAELPCETSMQIIVVDNGSTDGSREMLAKCPKVTTIVAQRPLGFSRANNAARDFAAGEVICFLNNDTTVERDWLKRPIQIFKEDPRVAAVGSKLRFMHQYLRVLFESASAGRIFVATSIFRGPLDTKVRWSRAENEAEVRGIRGRWVETGGAVYLPAAVKGIDSPPEGIPVVRLIAARGAEEMGVRVGYGEVRTVRTLPAIVPIEDLSSRADLRLVQNAGTSISPRGEGSDVGSGEEESRDRYSNEEVVPALCGASLFVRRTALDRAGWFPEYYGSYYEDVDLCLRLSASGGLLVFCPSSVVNHYHTGTNKELSPGFIENVARSSLLFVTRHGEPGVIAKSLVRRAADVRNEIRHIRGNGRWARMHGTRGVVKAIPGLVRVASERLGEMIRGSSGSRWFDVGRALYGPRQDARQDA